MSARRWKRADVTPAMLCLAIESHGVEALDRLCEHLSIPPKVLIAAVYRDTTRGYVNWGVSPWRPFLDRRGRMDIPLFKEDEAMQSEKQRHPESRAIPFVSTAERAADGSCCKPVAPERHHEVSISTMVPDYPAAYVQKISGGDELVAAALHAYADKICPPPPLVFKPPLHR